MLKSVTLHVVFYSPLYSFRSTVMTKQQFEQVNCLHAKHIHQGKFIDHIFASALVENYVSGHTVQK